MVCAYHRQECCSANLDKNQGLFLLRLGFYSDRRIEQQQNFPPLSRFFSCCSIEVIIFIPMEQQSNRNRKKSKNLRVNPIFYCSIRFGSFWNLGQTCLFEVSDRPNRIEQQTFVSTLHAQTLKNYPTHTSLEQLGTNNQPNFGCKGGGWMMMRCHRGRTRGVDFFLSFWAANGAMKERERGTGGQPKVAAPSPTNATTNQKMVTTTGWVGIFYEIPPQQNVWGGRLPVVSDGNLIQEKENEKIQSAAVDGHQLMKKHTTTNQSKVWVMIGGGFVTRIDRGRSCGGGLFRVVWGCECGNKKLN